MSDTAPDALTGRTVRALGWNYAGAAVRMVLSLSIGVVLARLLGPGPFGYLAVAALVTGLGGLVAELGLGPALVQRQTVCEAGIRYVFTMQVIIGAVLTLACWLLAPALAQVCGQPGAAEVVQALAPLFLIQAAGATSAALLRRSLRFQALQMADIASYVIGFGCLGLPLALAGSGVWSLVVAQAVQAVIYTVAVYGCVRHALKPKLRSPDAELTRFGWQVMRTNLTNWLIGNLDNAVVGRSGAAVGLGLYSRVFGLLFAPVTALAATLQRVLFPALSRVQADVERKRRAYLASVALMSLLTVPAYGCAALLAPAVVRGLLGTRWDGAIPLLAPLAVAMPLHALMALGGPMLWASNRVGDEARAQTQTALLCVVAFTAAATVSITCVAWVVAGTYAVRFLLVTRAALAAAGLGWKDFISAASGGVLLMGIVGPLLLITDGAVAAGTHPGVRLLADLAAGILAACGVTLLVPRQIVGAPLARYAQRLASWGPAAMRPLVLRFGLAGGTL